MLYAQLRDKTSSEKELIRQARETLKNPPHTRSGIGTGRLVDVGPLIMGHRLETRETAGRIQLSPTAKAPWCFVCFTIFSPTLPLAMDRLSSTDDRFRQSIQKQHRLNRPVFCRGQRANPKHSPCSKIWFQRFAVVLRQWVTETYLPPMN
jgi:hypothetical protein